jgi:hypothetical protein
MTPQAHRLPPDGSHPREPLAEWLLAIAILALFVTVFVIPVMAGWHG